MSFLSGKKAFFYDLDGTLAANNQPPSPLTVQAIRTARQQGHLVFLCTGRAPCHVYPSITEIGFDGIISGAGSYVVAGRQILYKQVLPPPLLKRIMQFYLDNGYACVLEGVQSLYAIHPDRPWLENWPVITHADAFTPGMGNYAGQEVLKFTAYRVSAQQNRELFSPDLDVIDHGPYLEIVPAGCCKSDGMRRVLEWAGLTRTDSVAFGDSRNDLDMLSYAGTGVAMGNAPDDVKQVADLVAPSFSQDGVAHEMQRWIS